MNYSPEKETMFIHKCHSFIQQALNECLLHARRALLTPEPWDDQRWRLSSKIANTHGDTQPESKTFGSGFS